MLLLQREVKGQDLCDSLRWPEKPVMFGQRPYDTKAGALTLTSSLHVQLSMLSKNSQAEPS